MKDKVTFSKETQVINHETGEVLNSSKTTIIKQSTEPAYIKLYIDCLLKFKDLSKSLNPILLSFLKRMNYASSENDCGGQVIYVNKQMKKDIGLEVGLSEKRITQALLQIVRSGIFKQLAPGKYQVNPNLFGKGEWKDIKNIRAMFDFKTGDIQAEIVKND